MNIKSMLTAYLIALSMPVMAKTLDLHGEIGTVGVLNHTFQQGKEGTRFDYKREGAQDILFPFYRLSADWITDQGTSVRFLYQPLAFETKAILERDIVVNDAVFLKDEPIDLLYSFPIYRISYIKNYDIADGAYGWGAAMQIRNANIIFSSTDGKKRRVSQDIGPVPLLVVHWKKQWDQLYLGGEISTIYAPVKYLNGSRSDVVGAFTDLSINLQKQFDSSSLFNVTARYLGGGAQGTSKDDKGPADGYSSNWIDLMTFSLGLTRSY